MAWAASKPLQPYCKAGGQGQQARAARRRASLCGQKSLDPLFRDPGFFIHHDSSTMLYERTALSKMPEALIAQKLATLHDAQHMSASLVMRSERGCRSNSGNLTSNPDRNICGVRRFVVGLGRYAEKEWPATLE